MPKLGQWRVDLDELLVANGAKASRERLTMTRIFETLQGSATLTEPLLDTGLIASMDRTVPKQPS